MVPSDVSARNQACGATCIHCRDVATGIAAVVALYEVGEARWVIVGVPTAVLGSTAVGVGKDGCFVIIDAYSALTDPGHAVGTLELGAGSIGTFVADAVAIVIACAVLFASYAVGSSTVDVGFRAVEHAVITAGDDAHTVLTATGAAVSTYVAATAELAAGACCSAAVHISLVSVGDRIGAADFSADIARADEAFAVAITEAG